MDVNTLLEKVENAKALDFGDIFNKSIELFKKVWLQGLIMLLLTVALMIPIYIVMYFPLIALGLLDQEVLQHNEDLNIVIAIPMIILVLLISFFAMIIGFGLQSAFYRICKNKDLNEMGSDDYFYFFKRPYLGKTINLAIMTFGISVVAMLLCVLPLIYVMVPIALITVIYALNPDLSASEIIKVGFKLGNRKWVITFGLLIVSSILAQLVGMLLCIVGVFVTASFSYLPTYFVYKESVGFEPAADSNTIEKSEAS
ncbi:hypothetical protein [Aestuariivivens sediminicola]|uniref:hypothetical protein n=1 Tax=Aestuariivivens sediminicola TaxID=2913560 RepID=UPI001F56EDC0|nr:hypothetical protein [Aestuariivivens sediminicola]